MAELSTVSETLYIPLAGRSYASKHYPDILYDKKALSIVDSLPEHDDSMTGQSEYTYMASAVRSKNMDYYIQRFLSENPVGIIVNVGCGLETTYSRNNNGKCTWYELDLPNVLKLRQKHIPKKGEQYLPYSMFDYEWIDTVKEKGENPILIVASGLFYYFTEEQVVDFVKHIKTFDNVQLVFDTVSLVGIKITKYYMKRMSKQDAEMFFFVERAEEFANKISKETKVIEERKFYNIVRPYKIKLRTKVKMFFSDLFSMVKIIHLKI